MNWLTRLLWTSGQKPPASWDEWIIKASDRNGFIREAAIHALAQSGHGPALRALLGRLNDWVPEVRRAALAAVNAFLVEEHAATWAASLGQVAALLRAGRADHSQVLERIAGFIVQPSVMAQVKARYPDISRDGRRYLHRLEFVAAQGDDRFEALQFALQSADIVIALMAAAEIHTIADASQKFELAGLACAGQFAPLRAAGLRKALKLGGRIASPLVEALCLDPNALVRSIALTSVAERGDAVRARAREIFRSDPAGRRRAVAFDVMCVLDPECRESLAAKACSDPAAVVRRTAFARSLAMIKDADRDPLIQRMLQDESALVRELAVGKIRRGASPPPFEWLRTQLDRRPASLNSLLRVSVHLQPWSRLEFLLRALVEAGLDDPSADRLQAELQAWDQDMFNCFMNPDAVAANAVRRLWAVSRDRVETKPRQRIAHQLQAFGVIEKLA